jgi:hypothetical protein
MTPTAADIRRYAREPLAFIEALIIPSASGPQRFGDVMADFQRDWFATVAPSLLAVAYGHKPPITRFWCERTKGASKDSDIACCLLWLLAFTTVPLDCQVGAADRDQAAELRKAATDIIYLNPWLGPRIEAQTWRLVCEATASACDIIASDVAGSHGARPDVVLLNELSHVTKETFAQNLLDNASKKPRGLVIIATNAGFTSTWQADWRQMASESRRWHFHTQSEPAPWLGDEELEEAERRNSRSRFRRLFWGEWVSQLGDALDAADIEACVVKSLGPMRATRTKGWFYIGGLDIGIKQDHSAFVVVAGRYDSQSLRLAYVENWAPSPRTGQVDLTRVERTILEMHERYELSTLAYDPYQAGLMAQRLSRRGLDVTEVPFVGKHLNEMASTLLDVFRSRRIRLYRHDKLIDDLGKLSIVEKSYGYRLEAARTQDGHADTATALSIALPLAVAESGEVPVVVGRPWESVRATDYDDKPWWQHELNYLKRQAELIAEEESDSNVFNVPDGPPTIVRTPYTPPPYLF